MSLRDLFVFAVVFGSIPFIFRRPYIGVLVWSWLAYMNPHRMTWGMAFDFRFSLIIAGVLLVAFLVSREPKKIIWTPLTVAWLSFFVWTGLTTLFALVPFGAAHEWSRWWKINLISLLTLLICQNKERLNGLVWMIVASLGFYGVKTGFFTISTGGEYRVFGPSDTFFEDNNAFGLVMILVLPLMRYLQIEAKERWVKFLLTAAMILTAASILGTHSRGALLGLIAMGAYLIWKSPGRLWLGAAAVILAPLAWTFMPESWHTRMDSISNYEQDGSAMGRINAWWFAFNLAKAHPIFGGGFNTFTEQLFREYAPDPESFHDAHSIYFEVLGEQGFIGLGLFFFMGLMAMANGRWVAKHVKGRPDLTWARNLSAMVQVSLVGYAIAGAFLGLAYFDLVYHLIVIAILARGLAEQALNQPPVPAPAPVAEPTPSGVSAPPPLFGARRESRS
jgi:probable O-glycosylation ligase (exosortase A-associated)